MDGLAVMNTLLLRGRKLSCQEIKEIWAISWRSLERLVRRFAR
jgi:hypothetical protein